jgi:hypothetical protein
MGDDSYDAFLNILEGDCNRSITVDSPPAVERIRLPRLIIE